MHCKRNLLAAISLVILAALLLSACSGKNKVNFSEMDDSELLQALTDFGVVIPENMGMDTVRGMIAELEENPFSQPQPNINWPAIYNLYLDLRSFIAYYEPNME